MTYTWTSPLGELDLTIPSQDRSLRPWDAADEYLLQELPPEARRILTVNDRWGALGAALKDRAAGALQDSFCSRRALLANRNGAPLPLTDSLDETPLEADLVLIKVPRSLTYFRLQLAALGRRLTPGTPLLAAGRSRNLPPSFFAAFEASADEAAYSRIWKKARFYRGRLRPAAAPPAEEFTHQDLALRTLPGVFSHGKVDPGSRFFLENFPRVRPPRLIVDPGCGGGLLTLAAARAWPEARLIATDDFLPALSALERSARANGVEERIRALHTDVLDGVEADTADLVLCNPPFHRQQEVSVETGLRFIRESARVLRPGGELFLVANRHLGYRPALEEAFASLTIIAQNKQFRIYRGRK